MANEATVTNALDVSLAAGCIWADLNKMDKHDNLPVRPRIHSTNPTNLGHLLLFQSAAKSAASTDIQSDDTNHAMLIITSSSFPSPFLC